jgi:hypothetical protein
MSLDELKILMLNLLSLCAKKREREREREKVNENKNGDSKLKLLHHVNIIYGEFFGYFNNKKSIKCLHYLYITICK